jgi:hypothetical protein
MVFRREKFLPLQGFAIPDRPTRSESVYRLRYYGSQQNKTTTTTTTTTIINIAKTGQHFTRIGTKQ